MNVSEVTCCCVDNGIFPHVARRLAAEYKKVYYWSPADRAFPVIRERCIGSGYPEITRIEHPLRVMNECDLYVFPDIGHCYLQQYLRQLGIPVWGSGFGDSLEIDRGKFLDALKQCGLPVPPHNVVLGLSRLAEYLYDKKDKYIKLSRLRGDFETFHWRSWDEDRWTLYEHQLRLGPPGENLKFYVFDNIESEIEDGCDAYYVGGWPKTIIHGMECKDKSFLGTFQEFDQLPDEVRSVNEKFGSVLSEYNYRGNFSTEVRITQDKEFFFIDPTARFGSPPSQVQMEMVKNWGEIIYEGALGNLVEMEPAAKFGVQAVAKLDRSAWNIIPSNNAVSKWLKVSVSCMDGGNICVPPDPEGHPELAWLTATGDSIKEAFDNLKANAKQMPEGISFDMSSLVELVDEVNKAEEVGMEFTDQPVPDKAEVV